MMKLLLLTAIKEFEKDIKYILKKANVKSYSYKDVKGYKDNQEEVLEANWFASDMGENESILFYVFVEKTNVDAVFDMVTAFNAKQKTTSQLHLVMLNIEKSNS